MSQDFWVFEEDGEVEVKRGKFSVSFLPHEAREVASDLAVAAHVARQQQRDLDPSLYRLPGAGRVKPGEATFLAWQLFSSACQVELCGDVRVNLKVGDNRVRPAGA